MFEYDERIDQLLIKNNIPEYVRILIQNDLEVEKTKVFAKYLQKEDFLSLPIESKDLKQIMTLHQETILYLGEWSWRTAYKLMFDYGLMQEKNWYTKLYPKLEEMKTRRTLNSHEKLQITDPIDRKKVYMILNLLTKLITERKQHSSQNSLHELLGKLKIL
jgi:hypothetical protein